MTESMVTLPVAIRVELFGVPAVLAARRDMIVETDRETLAGVASALAAACPVLSGLVLDAESGWLLGGYTFVVDDTFTRDREHPVGPGSSVLLVSSTAGG